MMRLPEANQDLGGIGTMLINADVCAACGEVHSEPRFLGLPVLLPGVGGCPLVEEEAGPTLSHVAAAAEPSPTFALPASDTFPEEIVLNSRPARDAEFAAPWPIPTGVF